MRWEVGGGSQRTRALITRRLRAENRANLYVEDLCGGGNLTKIHMRFARQRLAEINENYLLYTGESKRARGGMKGRAAGMMNRRGG